MKGEGTHDLPLLLDSSFFDWTFIDSLVIYFYTLVLRLLVYFEWKPFSVDEEIIALDFRIFISLNPLAKLC